MAKSEHTGAEIAAGAAVIAVAVGFFLYASEGVGLSRAAGSYDLQASFRSAEGISVGTEVRMAGVQIGAVTAMDLDVTTFRAETTFSVRDDIELPDDTAVSISSEGLLGGSFLEVLPGGSPFVLEPGDTVLDTQSAVSLLTLLMRFVAGDGQE